MKDHHHLIVEYQREFTRTTGQPAFSIEYRKGYFYGQRGSRPWHGKKCFQHVIEILKSRPTYSPPMVQVDPSTPITAIDNLNNACASLRKAWEILATKNELPVQSMIVEAIISIDAARTKILS
jgi:hypothetical protein